MAKELRESATVKRHPKNGNLFKVEMVVTEGKIQAICNSLRMRLEADPSAGVAEDILHLLQNAWDQKGN